MIYCKRCKIPVKVPGATVCPKCGQGLSEFGRSAESKPPPGPSKSTPDPAGPVVGTTMFTLEGEIQQLEEIKHKNVKRSRSLGLLSLAAALLILFVLCQVYAHTVLAYAVLSNVKVEQDPILPARILIKFDVVTPGKVAFDRRSGSRRTEKLDVYAEVGPQGFSWAWGSSSLTGIDFSVVYREGWFRTSLDRQFKLSEDFGLDDER